jgi:hypothetical protein
MGKFFKYIAVFFLFFAFEARADLTRDPALVKALVKGDMNQFYSMIEGGFPINAVDENGNSALHVAAFNGNRRIVDYLILAGANPNQQNYASETPSVVARRGGFEQLSDYLKYAGYNNNREFREYVNQDLVKSDDFIPPAPTSSSTILGMPTSVATSALLGVGVIGGAVAIAASSGGSSKTNNPTNPTNKTDTSPKADSNPNSQPTIYPYQYLPITQEDVEYNNNYGLDRINSSDAIARGYDGSIFNRNLDGTLIDNVPDGFVKVAVIDSGINSSHTDLSTNINTSLSRDCSSGTCLAGGTTDTVGHGTFVAGIIGALNNGVGVQGGATAPVASVHCGHEVNHLRAADLTDDDSIRPHAQRFAHEVAHADGSGALDVDPARLESYDVRVHRHKFGVVQPRKVEPRTTATEVFLHGETLRRCET